MQKCKIDYTTTVGAMCEHHVEAHEKSRFTRVYMTKGTNPVYRPAEHALNKQTETTFGGYDTKMIKYILDDAVAFDNEKKALLRNKKCGFEIKFDQENSSGGTLTIGSSKTGKTRGGL